MKSTRIEAGVAGESARTADSCTGERPHADNNTPAIAQVHVRVMLDCNFRRRPNEKCLENYFEDKSFASFKL